MSTDDEPTITIKLSAYDKLREAARLAQAEAYAVHAKLKEALLTDPDGSGTTQKLYDAFHEALKIVGFAIGNLPSETIAGWPHEALVKVTDFIDTIPEIDRHLVEVTDDWRRFAKQANGLEAARAEREKNRVFVMASAEDFGPKTPEAARVHATMRPNVAENDA